MASEDFEPARQVPSAPGQRALFEEPEVQYLRQCNRCGDREPSVYDAAESPGGCPKCHCPEFSLVPKEAHEMSNQATKKQPTVASTARKALADKSAAGSTNRAGAKGKSKVSNGAALGTVGQLSDQTRAKAQGKVNSPVELAKGELLHLRRDEIRIDPDQPRKEFHAEAMAELAESIRTIGILQPILVARCGGGYELIAGERRYRASGMAGRDVVPCYVRDMTTQQIGAARLIENDQREDLSAIEKARAYHRHLQQFELTQDQLAKDLGITQGQVSNTLRLLKLPNDWQKLIISGEITTSQARDLVPWADLPTVLDHLKEEIGTKQSISDLTTAEWGLAICDALDNCSKPIEGSYYPTGSYSPIRYDFRKIDDEKLKALDVRTWRDSYGRKEEGCFNLTLWKELVAEQTASLKVKADKKLSKQVDGPASKGKKAAPAPKRKPTAAELKEKAEQHARRIYAYKLRWLQDRIAVRVDQLPTDEITLLLVGFTLIGSNSGHQRRDLFKTACEMAGQKVFKGDGHQDSKMWAYVVELDRPKLKATLQEYVKLCMGIESRSWSCDANPRLIESFAATLQIDLCGWQPDEDFLKLHTIDQLCDLIDEWKLIKHAGGKAQLIAHIMNNSGKCKAPKSLLEVKSVELR